jgi:peptide/nickel transport system ATP-binding protein
MPDLIELPSGCSFHPRCPFAEDVCAQQEPPLVDHENGEVADGDTDQHAAACLAYTGELTGDLDYEVEIREAATPEERDSNA